MKLSEILRPELVLLPFQAADKWAAIAAMASAAADAGVLEPARLPEVEEALLVRERSMTTGMEDGIAIPHAAVEATSELVAVVAVCPDGIAFGALDGKPSRILVCLVIPRAKKLLHIKTLAAIARLLSRAPVRERILASASPEDVVAVVREEEGGAGPGSTARVVS